MPAFSIADIERGLTTRGAEQLSPFLARAARQHAAVAAILRERGTGPELLLVRRADRHGDPWSGHVALPGGLEEPSDRGPEDTARRETMEEIGVDLARGARVLGAMSIEVSKTKRGVGLLAIHPIVFELAAPLEPSIAPSAEIRRAFWIPLGEVATGRLDTIRPWRAFGLDLRMPAWSWDGEIVWGITHRIVSRLLASASPDAP